MCRPSIQAETRRHTACAYYIERLRVNGYGLSVAPTLWRVGTAQTARKSFPSCGVDFRPPLPVLTNPHQPNMICLGTGSVNPGGMTMYYVFQWKKWGHVIIDRRDCPYCNEARGIHPNSSGRNTRWHGPYPTYQHALDRARELFPGARNCIPCERAGRLPLRAIA